MKKELLEREKHGNLHPPLEEMAQAYSPASSSYNIDLDKQIRSRKQFPDEIAKMYQSTVFPYSPHQNPTSLNQYSALPPIGGGKTGEGMGRVMGSFPPTIPTSSNFMRGTMSLEIMPQWQREDLLLKEEQKKRNQQEIQDVLKQQIAAKEQLKQKEKMEKKMEDDREQQRIVKEQQMLFEKYAKEKEEQRKKEEQEQLEKQARLAKQKEEQERDSEAYKKLTQKSTKKFPIIKRQSPENSPIMNQNQVPFRSSSPPLPAVLKKMKEQGLDVNQNLNQESSADYQTPPQAMEQPIAIRPSIFDPDQPIHTKPQTAPFQEVIQPRKPYSPVKDKRDRSNSNIQQPLESPPPSNKESEQQNTMDILAQLALIQKVIV
jgi:hypothetical protein